MTKSFTYKDLRDTVGDQIELPASIPHETILLEQLTEKGETIIMARFSYHGVERVVDISELNEYFIGGAVLNDEQVPFKRFSLDKIDGTVSASVLNAGDANMTTGDS